MNLWNETKSVTKCLKDNCILLQESCNGLYLTVHRINHKNTKSARNHNHIKVEPVLKMQRVLCHIVYKNWIPMSNCHPSRASQIALI